jgi:hypothetical protein
VKAILSSTGRLFGLAGIALLLAIQVWPLPLHSESIFRLGRAPAGNGIMSPPRRAHLSEANAAELFTSLPLRFESCGKRAPRQFLARTGEFTVYLSATEAALVLRPTAGAGRLGLGADLGLPRNARSPHENEELPEPRRDRAAPRTHTAATLRMEFIGANRHAVMSGDEQLPTRGARKRRDIAVDSSGQRLRCGDYVFGYICNPKRASERKAESGSLHNLCYKVERSRQRVVLVNLLRGTDDSSSGQSIALSSVGDVYVTGSSSSKDFPLLSEIRKEK